MPGGDVPGAEGVRPSIAVEGDGPSVLFLHGGPGLCDYASMLAGELDGRRCIHYQQRGLPPSTVDGPFTVEQHRADALDVLDATRTPSAVLLGHSWGGMLALLVALHAPERVAGMVLVDPLGAVGDGGTARLGEALMARLPDERRRKLEALRASTPDGTDPEGATDPGDADLDARALAELRLCFPGYFADPSNAPELPEFYRLSTRAYAETLGSVMPAIADGSLAARLSALEMPAVVVVGAKSPLPNEAGRDRRAARQRRARGRRGRRAPPLDREARLRAHGAGARRAAHRVGERFVTAPPADRIAGFCITMCTP